MTTETPRRETYPLLTPNDELVVVLRDHIVSNARPVLFIRALEDSAVRVDSGYNLDDRTGVRVFDFSAGAGDTITVTENGNPTVLTEGVEFIAGTSNEITAISIVGALQTAFPLYAVESKGDLVLVQPDASVTALTFLSSDSAAWDVSGLVVFGPPQSLSNQFTLAITLPAGAVFDPLNKVTFFRVFSGKVAVDVRSLIEMRTYLRQPVALSGSTGHAGGWPVAPPL